MAALDPFVAEGFTYLGLVIALVLLRTYVRIRQVGSVGRLYLDDWFMLLALVPYITETVLAYLVGASFKSLSNTNMTDDQRRLLSPDSEEYRLRVGGSKVQVAGWVVYTAVLWAIKASLCAFYARLTDGVRGYSVRVRIGYVMLATTYVAVFCIILFSCQPTRRLWQIYPAPGNFCEPGLSKLYLIVPMVLNILTDIYLVIIPITLLKGAQIPTYKKYGLTAIFSGAIFCMTAGLLRAILVLQDPVNGIRQGSAWACRESFVAFVTANIPAIWGWMKIKLRPLFGSLLSSNSGKASEPTADSYRLADTNNSGRWKSQSSRFQTTTTVIRGGDADDESDSSIKELTGPEMGITKDVTVSVRSEEAHGTGGMTYRQPS